MANEDDNGTVETVAMNDRELFESATAVQSEPEPEATPEPAADPATPEPKADATGRLHGEGGKFAAKPKAEPAQAEPAEPEPHIDHRVPLTELLNEREKRQRFETEIAEERRQREALQRRIAELTAKPAEQPKTPDIFEDPQGYTASIEQRFEQRLRQQETNFSMRLAHRQHGQEFETAYQALVREGEMGNRQAVQSIMASADPGEALMKWHRQATLYEKTGGDLDKFLQAELDKALEDESFLAKAMEKARARANGQPNGQRPASVVQLPPSLNKVPAAASVLAAGDDDIMSDAALFRHATSR